MSQDLLIETGGAIRGGGYALDGSGTTQGFWLGANGVLKADAAEFYGAGVNGSLGSASGDFSVKVKDGKISFYGTASGARNILGSDLTEKATLEAAAAGGLKLTGRLWATDVLISSALAIPSTGEGGIVWLRFNASTNRLQYTYDGNWADVNTGF
jgi:hypothetical protein